ncbi:uncharacterized protein MYCGRDRAFT_94828 [Zymoseptoria tritici IPO323]|uniref:Uncharacterized protein n=1 Tax=Zymoseptoria tritici (strain CBS 115943 / IPO323) TaxID=336722 RepID=F9XFF5_ZYMTI|nr:uncharacterized protein MYCGRDRAFT_94828 [Zymoseptoria tritici IPO323]EGP85897.1 hypothetical protein MYCGRDRAFT_94828 [Zymoseptoria tritici IPO323]
MDSSVAITRCLEDEIAGKSWSGLYPPDQVDIIRDIFENLDTLHDHAVGWRVLWRKRDAGPEIRKADELASTGSRHCVSQVDRDEQHQGQHEDLAEWCPIQAWRPNPTLASKLAVLRAMPSLTGWLISSSSNPQAGPFIKSTPPVTPSITAILYQGHIVRITSSASVPGQEAISGLFSSTHNANARLGPQGPSHTSDQITQSRSFL